MELACHKTESNTVSPPQTAHHNPCEKSVKSQGLLPEFWDSPSSHTPGQKPRFQCGSLKEAFLLCLQLGTLQEISAMYMKPPTCRAAAQGWGMRGGRLWEGTHSDHPESADHLWLPHCCLLPSLVRSEEAPGPISEVCVGDV